MSEIHILPVFVAALSSFLVGGLWYSPKLFGAIWTRENGFDSKTHKGRHPASVFAVSFVFSVLSAAGLAGLLGASPSLVDAWLIAAVVSLAFVGASFGINYQFAGRSWTLLVIDAGYHFVQLSLMALVLVLLA